MVQIQTYETVIGLEVHVQLSTETKVFSSDPNRFGEEANTNVSPVSLGLPGSLPAINEKVVEYAVMLGLAVNSRIAGELTFSRKNYFYTDLPKGYQISQYENPICSGGYIIFRMNGSTKKVNLTRIHIEEDAGKSIHDLDPENTMIDLNRAGIPLLEIVSEPEIRSGEEAFHYLAALRQLVRFLGISDGNMEEGSLRCDANVSVRRYGDKKLGTRIEIKNLNSFSNVRKAIEFETARQISMLESGQPVIQHTVSFDEKTSSTFPLRMKEEADDYRYFPEPDLNPFIITNDYINRIKSSLPALPWELYEKFTTVYGLSDYDARLLSDDFYTALFFEKVINETGNFKAAANWIIGPVKNWINEQPIEIKEFPVSPETISSLINMIDAGEISFTLASREMLPLLIKNPGQDPRLIARKHQLEKESDEGKILKIVQEILAKYPGKVKEYHGGKKGLMGLFMGDVMRLSGGKADPEIAKSLILLELEKRKGNPGYNK